LREAEFKKSNHHLGHHTEQYAFSDFLHRKLTREWALYEWKKQKSKPTKADHKDEEKPRIDFQGPTYDQIGD